MQAARHYPRPNAGLPALMPLIWLLVSLVVFATLPGMMSGNYLPKVFWTAATVGLGLAILPPRRTETVPVSLLGLIWSAYLGWALLSAVWAIQPGVTFERWLVMLLLTFAYLLAGRTRFWKADAFWRGFALISSLVAAIGIIQYYAPSFSPANYFPGTAVPRATMGHRNYAGMYFMVIIPFLAWLYFRSRGRQTFFFFFALIMGTVFLLLVKTRGAWLGLASGAIFFLAAGGGKKVLARRFRLALLAGTFLAALFLAVAFKPSERVARMMAGKADLLQTARTLLDARGRIEFWRGLPGITDPLLGAGFGNFPIVATPYDRTGKVKTLNWEVHNDYLQAYVDLGLPGAVLFLASFVILVILAWRGRGRGILLAAGVSVTGLAVMQFTIFTMEVVSTQVWIAGVAAILNRQRGLRAPCKLKFPVWSIPAFNFLGAAILLLLAAAVGFTIRGDREFRRGQAEFGRMAALQEALESPEAYPAQTVNRLQRELEYARTRARTALSRLAVRVMPTMFFDANMRHISAHQTAGMAMSLGDYPLAEKFARQALALHPADRTSLIYLTEIALRRGNVEEVRALIKRGVEIFGPNPHSPYFCRRQIGIYRNEGRLLEAERIREGMERNRVLRPSSPTPADRAAGVDPSGVIFSWAEGNAAHSYDLFLWKAGEEEPDYPRFFGLKENRTGSPLVLAPETTYFWRVRAIGRYWEESGPIWFFRTGEPGEANWVDFLPGSEI